MSLIVNINKKLASYTLSVSFETDSPALSLLGASGSGKSVTLKCIAGILKPDEGLISYNGHVLYDSSKGINLPPQKRNVGYLFQNYALFPDMSVRKNILLGMLSEKDKAKKEAELKRIAAMLNITHVLDQRPWSLSGGESQRVALARMLVNKPELLLFDEPFSALDTHLRSELQPEFLSLIQRYGRDYVLVTHSKEEASHLSQDTIILDHGKITEEGKTLEVFKSPGSVTAARLIGCRNIGTVKDGKAWGIPVDAPKGTTAIGVMEDSFRFSPDGWPAEVSSIMRERSSKLVLFRFKGSSIPAPLWMRVSEDTEIPKEPKIAFEDVMFLSKN